MQQILFTEPDPYKNFKNLAIFASKCGLDIEQLSTDVLHLRNRRYPRRQNKTSRVNTGIRLSHLFALESVARGECYPTLTVTRENKEFAQTMELVIINICDDLVGRILQQITGRMQNLRILNLHGCTCTLDDTTIQIITEKCPQLVHLDLGFCGMIHDTLIYNTMKNCKELRCFGVSSSHVTSMAIKDLVEELPYLTALGIGTLAKDRQLTDSIQQVGVDVRFTLECIGDCRHAISK